MKRTADDAFAFIRALGKGPCASNPRGYTFPDGLPADCVGHMFKAVSVPTATPCPRCDARLFFDPLPPAVSARWIDAEGLKEHFRRGGRRKRP